MLEEIYYYSQGLVLKVFLVDQNPFEEDMGKAKHVAKRDDEPDPVAKALSIPEVLEIILEDLDVGSLLNCRLVNSSWDKRASSVLKRRPAWIQVRTSIWSNAFTRLYKCVRKSKDFPFPGLKLIGDHYFDLGLQSKKASKYFRKFGKIHTHLQIDVKFPCEKDFIENVLSKLPHIKFLGFDRLVFDEEEELDLKQFSMPNLTTLCFLGIRGAVNKSVLKTIINAAPSLENIQHVRTGLVPTIWEDKEKVELVSSMILNDKMCRSISEQLIENPPSLKVLSILRRKCDRPNRAHFVTALEKVFLGSQNTLLKLILNDVCINFDPMPVFEHLMELDVTMYVNQSQQDPFEMIRKLSSRCFPKLQKIRFDLNYDIFMERLNSNNFELEEESLVSVKVLELDSQFALEMAKFLAKKFPCVRHIRAKHIKADTSVWSLGAFPCLRKLDIRGFPLDPKRFLTHTMDQYLTGIPREICAKLRTLPPFVMDPFYNDILRPNGSLIQLTALKELTVSILPFVKLEELSSENPFVSMISVRYALKFLPGLRTRFLCHPSKLEVVKKAVELVQDYVSVVAWTEPEVLY